MLFRDPAVAAVFARYEARAEDDRARMRELGPAGMALRDEFLLPVGVDVGRLLHALVLARRPSRILELGTSYGYSTLFLADAARQVGARLVTMELAPAKQAYARAQLAEAGLADVVDWRCGDALALLAADPGAWDFVLLDIWKELYRPCFEAFYPNLSEEGVVVSDNMIDPPHDRPAVRLYRAAVEAKADLRSTLLPVGSGIELTVRWSPGNSKL
ncbi:class I SAM-dependent methyltransferase [Novosphingobium sp. 1949]|uniref:Class I SAM-dependent methyltransferase n=1 Tax=Novosphingobium organovorum TaxID=2930092 RepID=A0ABT0BEW7_9SPHN|nr:class I SAM-dependent methyltransferase [Novosphingobium organovorum]MCJ2183610.1 class I SAM-dependent methyltransferase [Novosphingobium organovorum]